MNEENRTLTTPETAALDSVQQNVAEVVTATVGEAPAAPTEAPPPGPQVKKSETLLIIETPITGDNACGVKASSDPDFQAISNEIQKLSAAGSPNFQIIVEKGLALTKEKTKDLRLLTWLCLGLFSPENPFEPPTQMAREEFLKLNQLAQRTEEARYNSEREARRKEWLKQFRCQGLADGLEGLLTIGRDYWDTLYPESLKARANALSWLGERIPPLLSEVELTSDDKEPLERANNASEALLKLVMEKLVENPPKLSPLNEAVQKALKRVPRKIEVAPPKPKPAPAPGPLIPTPAPEIAPIDVADLKSALESVRKIGSSVRGLEPKNPVAYRLTRLARWAVIKQEPTASPDGKTRLPGPQAQLKTGLETLASQGNWAALLERCEQTFSGPQGLFWLDLQRLACEAARQLGYIDVTNAILLETALFVSRLPGLSNLKFEDGVPFADSQTQGWLADDVKQAMAGGSARPYVFISGEGDPQILSEFEHAQKLYNEGDLEGALMQIQQGLVNNPTPKSRFRRLLHLAMLCLKDKKAEAARPVLETLELEVEKYDLRDWDPELTLQVWSHLIRTYQMLLKKDENKDNQDFNKGFQRVFEKICQLDVRFALNTLEQDSKPVKSKIRSTSDGIIPTRDTQGTDQPDVRAGHGGSEEKDGIASENARTG